MKMEISQAVKLESTIYSMIWYVRQRPITPQNDGYKQGKKYLSPIFAVIEDGLLKYF